MKTTDLVRRLRTEATDLTRRGENLFRVRAYRRAAMALSGYPDGFADALADGERLARIPGVGVGLAEKIAAYCRTGVWPDRAAVDGVEKESGPSESTARAVTAAVADRRSSN